MTEPEKNPVQPTATETAETIDAAEAERLAHSAKKRRTVIIWMRVIAVMFAGFFLLSQCGMSKPKAKAAIVESCIKNVPFAEKWQADLKQRGLSDPDGRLVADYCVCMWDKPLSKLSTEQIQSFAKIDAQERLRLLGGEAAFNERDKQCIGALK